MFLNSLVELEIIQTLKNFSQETIVMQYPVTENPGGIYNSFTIFNLNKFLINFIQKFHIFSTKVAGL